MSKKETSIRQKFVELDQKIEWFHSDEFELEKALENYKKTLALAKEIEETLNSLKNEIEIIEKDFGKKNNTTKRVADLDKESHGILDDPELDLSSIPF